MNDRQLAVYADAGRECFRCVVGVSPAENELRVGAGDSKVAPALRDGETVAEGDRHLRHGVSELPLGELTTTAELFKQIDFTYKVDAPFTGTRLARRPYLAQPQRVMPTAVDLNRDGEPEFVVAARLEPVVAALDHRGNLLWASRVDLSDAPPPSGGANHAEPPAVLQMLPTRDFTGDGVRDVLVLSMAIRSPPGVNPQAVYPKITLLNGRDGSLVWTTAPPPITAANGSRWPLAGLLGYRVLPNYRCSRPLSVSNHQEVTRSVTMEDRRVLWSNQSRANLPVTPPIELLDDGQHALVVTAASEVRKLELTSGRLGDPIALAPPNSALAVTPRTIRRGANREPGILANYLEGKAYGMLVGERLALYDPAAQAPLWSKPLVVQTNMADPGFEQSDFPFVADLDHDGIDEILVAAADVAANGGGPRTVHCLDAETGADRWPVPVRVRCVELSPERICLLGDVDADGVDDLAIGSLYGEAMRDNSEMIRSQRVDLSIYIDVVSGRDGQRLTWARQPVGEVDQFTGVVEIDSLRLASPGVLEASLVWGNGQERLLDSLSVRFSLKQDGLPQLARGLTALTRLSQSGAGFYLRRPGPDELGGETAVWIEPKSKGLLVTGYQWVMASWHNAQGVPRVLLSNRDMSRIAAVEVPSGRVLWRQATTGTLCLARHLRRSKHDCLLVQSFDAVSRASRLSCLDAETGQVWAALANQPFGGIYDAAPCANDSDDAFLLTGPVGPLPMNLYSPGLHVRKIAFGTGETAWEKSALSGLMVVSGIQCPVTTLIADVNGDGISDCIVPDESLANGIRLVAISGVDGQELWSCPTQLGMNDWPWNTPWPLMELAPSHEGESHLVFMDKRGSDKIVVRLLRLSDGRELDSRAYASDARRFGHLPRHAGLSLWVDHSGDKETAISLAVPTIDEAQQLTIEHSRLQIREGRLSESPDAAASGGRIVLTRESLTRYSGEAVVWRRTLPPAADRPSLIATTDPKHMILRSEKSDTLLDFSTGQPACGVPRVELNDRPHFVAEGPTLLMNSATPHLVHQQRDGVRIGSPLEAARQELPPDAPISKKLPDPGRDPRHWREPAFSPLSLSDRTLMDLVVSMMRVGVQSLFAFIIPLAGISWLIQKRRFSLAQLSLAPLAALACVMTWRMMLTAEAIGGDTEQEPWFIVLFSGTMTVVAAAFVVRCIVERRVWPFAVALALAMGVTAALQWMPALLAGDGVRYRVGLDDFLAGTLGALIAMLSQGYVLWSFVRFIARRIGRRGRTRN